MRVSYQPPPEPYQPATPPPAAPVGQYSPDGRWYWDGRQWNPVTIPGPPWARPYAPPEGRSAAAVALVALATAGAVLFVPGELLDLIAALVAPGSALELAAGFFVLLGLLLFGVGLIGSAVAVPMWMHRAFRNLPALGEQGMRWSPAWAAGGWFIPFANFVIPYQVMRVLWSSFGDPRSLPQLWWTAWIGAAALQIISNEVMRFNRPAGDFFGILNDLATIAAGYLLITMIRRITRRQRDRHGQRELQGY